MLLAFITLFVALTISAIAAYFSVIGLIALFAATAIPVAIMGGALEIGKIVSAAWLHRHWKKAPFLLKTYLTIAVMALMLLTSIGIYGFLSKGHLDQQAPIGSMQAQIERNITTIDSYEDQIVRLRDQLEQAAKQDSISEQQNNEARKLRIQAQIDEITLQAEPIDAQIAVQREVISRLEDRLLLLDETIQAYNELGAITKGRAALADQQDERTEINQKIGEATDIIIELENKKISLNSEISKLRQQMYAPAESEELSFDNSQTAELNQNIETLNDKILSLEDENLELQIEINATTAKLGPIQYVADLFNIEESEKAVQALIVLIMFAFDPIAVALLIASQWAFLNNKKEPKAIHNKSLIEENEVLQKELSSLQSTSESILEENSKLKNKLQENEKLNTDSTYQFVVEKLQNDPDLTQGLKDLLEHDTEASDIDLNDGVLVNKATGAKRVIKQIMNPKPSAWIDTKNKKV